MRSNFTMKIAAILALASISLLSQFAFSQTAEEHFRNGLSAFQKNDLDLARTEFSQANKLDPSNFTILYNLGLTEFKAKNAGLALGLWRKALVLNPGSAETAHAIAYAENSLPQKAFLRGSDLYESFRKTVLVESSLFTILMITLILFSFAGWVLVRYFAARSRSLENEEPSPSIPYIGFLFSLLFVVASIIAVAKIYDLSITRATIVTEKVEVKTSPDATSATLFELFEGLEVVVRQSSEDWLQVYYPGGLSGWVPANSVIQSGRP